MDLAIDADQGAGSGQGHAVLAGAGLGQYLGLAHVLGQQGLAEAVVDLVGAGVVQILALEEDTRATEMVAESPCQVQRAGSAGIVGVEHSQFLLELWRLDDPLVGLVDVVHDLLQFGRNHLPAVFPEITLLVRHGCEIDAHPVLPVLVLLLENRRKYRVGRVSPSPVV